MKTSEKGNIATNKKIDPETVGPVVQILLTLWKEIRRLFGKTKKV